MIMKDKTQCKTCIYGEVLAGSYFCNRCYDESGKFYPRRIAKRTENYCYDYIEKGQNKMDIIKEEIQKPETTTVIEEKPQKRIWTDEDCKTLIEFYNNKTEYSVLAEMFSVSKKQIAQKVFNLKNSEKWKNCFTDSGTISETEIVAEAEAPAEPVTTLEERESSPIKDHINDLKVHFADFVIDECRREEVPGVVELVGAYLKYLEKRVKE